MYNNNNNNNGRSDTKVTTFVHYKHTIKENKHLTRDPKWHWLLNFDINFIASMATVMISTVHHILRLHVLLINWKKKYHTVRTVPKFTLTVVETKGKGDD